MNKENKRAVTCIVLMSLVALAAIGGFTIIMGYEESHEMAEGVDIYLTATDEIVLEFFDMEYKITKEEPCNLAVEYWMKDYSVDYTVTAGKPYEVQVKKRYITRSRYWITERKPRDLRIVFVDPNGEPND